MNNHLKKEANVELKEFISTAITQIAEGIKEAQEKGKENGYIISPRHCKNSNGEAITAESQNDTLEKIHFNLSVTTEYSGQTSNETTKETTIINTRGNTDNSSPINNISFDVYAKFTRAEDIKES